MTKYLLFALLFIPQWALSKANINTVSVEVVTELSPPNQLLQNDQVAGTSTELVKKILKKLLFTLKTQDQAQPLLNTLNSSTMKSRIQRYLK